MVGSSPNRAVLIGLVGVVLAEQPVECDECRRYSGIELHRQAQNVGIAAADDRNEDIKAALALTA